MSEFDNPSNHVETLAAQVLGVVVESMKSSSIKDCVEPIAHLPEDVKQEPIKEEPIKQEPIKEETTKEEPIKEEPIKEEPVKEETIKEEPVKVEPLKVEPVKVELVKVEPVIKLTTEEAKKKEPISFTSKDFVSFGKPKVKHFAEATATAVLTITHFDGSQKKTKHTSKSNASAKNKEAASLIAETSAKKKATDKLANYSIPSHATSTNDVSVQTKTWIETEPILYQDNAKWHGIVLNETNSVLFAENVTAHVLVVGPGGNGGKVSEGGGGGGAVCLMKNVTLEANTCYFAYLQPDGSSFKKGGTDYCCEAKAGHSATSSAGGFGGIASVHWLSNDGQKVTSNGGNGGYGADATHADPSHGFDSSALSSVHLPFIDETIHVGGGGGGSKTPTTGNGCGGSGFGRGGYPATASSEHNGTVVSSLKTGYGAGGGGNGGKGGNGVIMIWYKVK